MQIKLNLYQIALAILAIAGIFTVISGPGGLILVLPLIFGLAVLGQLMRLNQHLSEIKELLEETQGTYQRGTASRFNLE